MVIGTTTTGARPVEPAVLESTEAADATADRSGSTTLPGTPPVDPIDGDDVRGLEVTTFVGTVPVDVATDDPGTITDGSPAPEATLDAALESSLAIEGTGIGNGRTAVPD